MMVDAAQRNDVLRVATAADAAVIARHRVGMFRDMRVLDEREAVALEAGSRAHLTTTLANGAYLGWLIEHEGVVVAGAGVLLRATLPRPGYPQGGEEAYLLNVYTDPAHRRRGLARRLTEHVLTWCATRGIARVSLHASDEGRPLYTTLGFVPTNEMRRDTTGHQA